MPSEIMILHLKYLSIFFALITCVFCTHSQYECDQKLVPCGCGLNTVRMSAHHVSGEDAAPHSWSMIAAIRFDCHRSGNISTHCCSGTILNDFFILTAAHCVDMISKASLMAGNVTVVTGIHTWSEECQIIRKVNKISLHSNWTRQANKFNHDIAILRVDKALDFKKNLLITRTCIPSQQNSTNNVSLVMIGWNFTNSQYTTYDTVQQTSLVSLHETHSRCFTVVNDASGQFCATAYEGVKGACVSNSGGSILQWIGDRWEQVGIVSYTKEGCQTSNYTIISTRIAAYSNWIYDLINERNDTTSNSTRPTTTVTTSSLRPASVYGCQKTNVSCGCGLTNVTLTSPRIVGGEAAVPYSWSMIVSLRYKCISSSNQPTHCCGGTILNRHYILTAAHCVDTINEELLLSENITIVAGIHNQSEPHQTIRRVDRIFIHPEYIGSSDYFRNDIAILHLSEPLDLDTNPRITRTCRPSRQSLDAHLLEYPTNGSMLSVIGWGLLSRPGIQPELLQQLSVYAIHYIQPLCAQNIGDPRLQLCAGVYADRKGPCNGDSGGPIMLWSDDHWEQVGIASYVIRGCAAPGYPSVYTRVAAFHDWIESIIHQHNNTMTTTVAYRPSTIYQCNNSASACGCGTSNVILSSPRLIGGNEAIPYSWSMTISIRFDCHRSGNIRAHCCAGSILNEHYILTAASCFDQINVSNITLERVTVVAGIHNLTEKNPTVRNVDRVFIHPEYTGQRLRFRNDIAILHLSTPLNIRQNSRLAQTCLPPTLTDLTTDLFNYPSNGSMLAVVGWGALDKSTTRMPQLLQQMIIYAIPHNEPSCARSIEDVSVQFCGGLYEGGRGICYGDGGGPVFQWLGDRWEQVGITSYSMHTCATFGYQSVFTRLVPFHSWIHSIINDGNDTTQMYTGSTTSQIYINSTIPSINNTSITTTRTSGSVHPCIHSSSIALVGMLLTIFKLI